MHAFRRWSTKNSAPKWLTLKSQLKRHNYIETAYREISISKIAQDKGPTQIYSPSARLLK